MSRGRSLVCLAGAAALFALAAYGDSTFGTLSSPGANDVQEGIAYVSDNTAVVVGDIVLCVNGTTSATVTAVDPVDPVGSFQVDGFILRPISSQMIGDAKGTLQALGIEGSTRVDARCHPSSSVTASADEMVLQLSKPSGKHASSRGFDIHYEVNGHKGSFRVPLSVVLCQEAKSWVPACARER